MTEDEEILHTLGFPLRIVENESDALNQKEQNLILPVKAWTKMLRQQLGSDRTQRTMNNQRFYSSSFTNNVPQILKMLADYPAAPSMLLFLICR